MKRILLIVTALLLSLPAQARKPESREYGNRGRLVGNEESERRDDPSKAQADYDREARERREEKEREKKEEQRNEEIHTQGDEDL